MNYKDVDFLQNHYINEIGEIEPYGGYTNGTSVKDFDTFTNGIDNILQMVQTGDGIGIMIYTQGVSGSTGAAIVYAVYYSRVQSGLSAGQYIIDDTKRISIREMTPPGGIAGISKRSMCTAVEIGGDLYLAPAFYDQFEYSNDVNWTTSGNSLIKYTVGTGLWSSVTDSGLEVLCISRYKNRVVIGKKDGSIVFSTTSGYTFTVGATVNDALKFQISDSPIVCIREGSGGLFILDANGKLYAFQGDLISTTSAVGVEELGKIDVKPNHRSMLVVHDTVYLLTNSGVLKLKLGMITSYDISKTNKYSNRYFKLKNEELESDSNYIGNGYGLEMAYTDEGFIIIYDAKSWVVSGTATVYVTYIGYYIYTDTYFYLKFRFAKPISTPTFAGFWLVDGYIYSWVYGGSSPTPPNDLYENKLSVTGTSTYDNFVLFNYMSKLDTLQYTGNFTILFGAESSGTMKIYYKSKSDVKLLKSISVTGQSFTSTDTLLQNIFNSSRKLETERIYIGSFDESGQVAINFNGKIYELIYEITEV